MTTDQLTRTPPIRGEERLALVEALALAKKTHVDLAAEFGRTLQAIHQFSARNAAEIASRREVLLGDVDAETAHSWVAKKAARIDWYQKLIEDLEIRLADEDLDPRVRSRFTRDVAQLLRSVAEEKGELRTQLEVEAGPRLTTEVIGWEAVAWSAGRAAGRTDPATPEPAPESAPAPEPARAPASTPAPAPASDGSFTYGGSNSGSSIFRSMSF